MYIRTKKVLLVDDSVFFSNFMKQGLQEEAGIEVVGTAENPFEARDKILELEPDVMTLDIELPQMDGIEFLRKLLPQYPLPVLVVSAHEEKREEALEAGAVDFLLKPEHGGREIMAAFLRELIVKLKLASMENVSDYKNKYMLTHKPAHEDRIIAIGASTGGTEAVLEVVRELPRNMPGIVVAQHMPGGFTAMYAERMNITCRMAAKEAANGDRVEPGRILLAPGGYQTKVRKDAKGFYVEVVREDKVNGHRPSVDVLFHSVAGLPGADAIGVILTGMGADGAKGIKAMRDAGAHTIGQDERTCVVYGMPKVAFDIGGIVEQLPPEEIGKRLYALAHL